MVDDIKELRSIVKQSKNTGLSKGDKWAIVSARWYEKLLAYIGLTSDYAATKPKASCEPGAIDNRDICDEHNKLKYDLDESSYYIVHQNCFEYLNRKFGCISHPIYRHVIEIGKEKKDLIVEVYEPRLKVKFMVYPDAGEKTIAEEYIQISRVTTIKGLCDSLLEKIHIKNVHEVRLARGKGQHFEEVEIDSNTLYDDGIGDNSELLFEVFTESNIMNTELYDGPIQSKRFNYGSATGHWMLQENAPGLCGLWNLGNTCFMNSAIQCLSNIPVLTDYFRNSTYLKDLNEENPLGMKGKIAKAYAELILHLWSGKVGVYSPNYFKGEISRFAHQFSGYSQQDSQELMAFLLDGLHEDLNRIRKKPYIQQAVDERLSDNTLAEHAWNDYKKRNDSVIVDIFHGLIKSTLNCLRCSNTSRIFDPFCFLSLPIPFERHLVVYFISSTNQMKRIRIAFPPSAYARRAIDVDKLRKEIDIPESQLYLLEFSNCDYNKMPLNGKIVLSHKTIFACQVPPATNQEKYVIALFRDETSQNLSFPAVLKIPAAGINFLHLNGLIENAFATIFRSFFNTECCLKVHFDLALINDALLNNKDGLIKLEQGSFIRATLSYDGELQQDNPSKFNIHDFSVESNEIDLYDCLKAFTTVEELSEQDYWYCPKCANYQPATKKLDIWRLPKVLIIHLKRFYYYRFNRDKIETCIKFPLENLAIEQFVGSRPDSHSGAKYNLIAISNHYGGLDGGHYTAFAKNRVTKQWYVFDDKNVQRISESQLCSPYAYILFYMREDEFGENNKNS